MGYALTLNPSANGTLLPVANVPVVSDADDLPMLFSFHRTAPFLAFARLASRARTAFIAIRLRSPGDSFTARAFPPLLAISAIRLSDSFSARALPPRRPSATAFGFFFPLTAEIILLIVK
jgi:hypothetical protein